MKWAFSGYLVARPGVGLPHVSRKGGPFGLADGECARCCAKWDKLLPLLLPQLMQVIILVVLWECLVET